MANPADLNINPQPDTDKNFFNFKAVGLKIDKTYAIKFQWIYDDLSLSDWSPGFFVNTSTESVPAAPTNSVTGGAGFITISLPTFPANALRVDVRIAGGTFGNGTVVAESFTSAGVKTIAAAGSSGQGSAYVVTLLTVTPSKINGDPSSPVTVYVTDPSAALVVTAPQDPFAPTVRSGLASVIVEWSGKKSDGADLTVTGFNGAKVHIGTTSNFTPSADNWVHTLNFANGSNRVSIGVGSIIDKTAGTTLQYGTAYHVKLVSVNASGTLSSPVAASNNPVTVAKLPASEISTGILTADNSITAGVAQGQRAVLSGSTSPFIIYGTDGTTKLLEFLTSGTTGTLAIKGSGTFTGDISASSGTIGGITLNSSGLSSTNFSISSTGIITATSGTIGGWAITGSVLESPLVSNNKISFNPATPKIALIRSGVEAITIDPVEGIKDSAENFKLTPTGILTLKGSITSGSTITGSTINGSNINLSGVQTGTGSGASYTESSDTSTRLSFTNARYTIIPANDTWTESVSIPSYDYVNDEWTSAITSSTYTSNTIKFTDSVFEGGVPNSTYYYGETWYEGGSSSGSVINYVNYLGGQGYMGFEIRANTAEKGFYFIGDSDISGQNWGIAHPTTAASGSKDQPAMLQTDASGKVTRGRAIFTTGSSSATILGNTWTSVGQNGDLAFSTNN